MYNFGDIALLALFLLVGLALGIAFRFARMVVASARREYRAMRREVDSDA